MRLLTRMLKQKMVYWAPSATPDAYGRPQYEDGVEMSCRWEVKAQEFINPQGDKKISSVVIYSQEDLETGGLVLLGTLDDVDYDGDARAQGAVEIQQVGRVPNLRAKQFLKQAFI